MPQHLMIDHVHVGDGNPDEELQLKQAFINAATAATHEIVAAVPGRKIRVVNLYYRAAGNVTIQWKSGSTDKGGPEALQAGWGMSDRWAPFGFFLQTEVGEALNLTLAQAVQVSGTLNYVEV